MKISLATFNVENLVTAGKPIYDGHRPHYNQDEYRKKTVWIKNQLLKMNADIIGFQEIFEERALRECLTGTPMANWHLFVANPTGKTPVNAILSKFPIIETEVIEDLPFVFDFFDEKEITAPLESAPVNIPLKKFSRGVLKAEIKINENVSALVIVLHLKSKRPILADNIDRNTATSPELAKGSVRSLIRRGIESCGIRQILSDEINKDEAKPIFILGDLNDNDTAVTNQAILGEEPFRSLPLEIKIKKWKHVFQNCKDIQARKSIENFYYTYIHNGHYESLDNIFVSNHFAELNSKRIGRIIDVRLYNDHVIDDKTSMDKKPIYIPDHGQVMANIDLLQPTQSAP
ncbi:endonuclease/exonuclease/phosphatase family protein [Nitrosomonas sp. Is37]|uniref:endonuclease/exonuclease/phosphatase family protein n=1 Tax=Nitrosomonas sp. Is37 TaxID=3080535 RepID=UPI00294B419B|nr:endonuclease/exonuclease/phosphatase family protein [Nitrosomonas sp. Is37]MDV6345248.1 endonuclease/exonuclease/phosphatase family protein [Nitrosomonas sp. Is37]